MGYLEKQRQFFATGATLPLPYRRRQLLKLLDLLDRYEADILAALAADLGKSREEAYITEIAMVRGEVRYFLCHLPLLAMPRLGGTPLTQQPAVSVTVPRPKGVCLIMAPWNYPIQLTLSPLAAAFAAGNCAVVKPSELAPATEALLARMLADAYPPQYCQVVTGGPEVASQLAGLPFDHILFTGSGRVGRLVLQQAAANLTPVTLELGGKSPCIVDETADIPASARRIAWGKCLNAGQTCVAPDLVYVHRSVKDQLVRELTKSFLRYYGPQPHKNPEYPKIISQKHYQRLIAMLSEGTILAGGVFDEAVCKIAPTLLENAAPDSPLMTEEIFGPLLPILPYDQLDTVVQEINARSHPLALYLFSTSPSRIREITRKIPFGGGCINDTVSHLCSHSLPFGGIGGSGMGQYHSRWGFDTFTHYQGLMMKPPALETPLRYPPLAGRMELFRLFLR